MTKRDRESIRGGIGALTLISTFWLADFLQARFAIEMFWTGLVISFVFSLLVLVIVMLIIGEIFKLPYSRAYRKKMKALNIAEVDTMSGLSFEKYVEMLLKHQGYKTKLTPRKGDFGVDILAKREGEKLAIQCKRYSNKVSRNAVSDIVAGGNHYGAEKYMVVTTNYFQKGAIQLAKSNSVELIDRDTLAEWILDFQSEAT